MGQVETLYLPPDMMPGKEHNIILWVPAKNEKPESNHESSCPKLRNILQKKLACVLQKNVKIAKDKERLRNHSRLNETREV